MAKYLLLIWASVIGTALSLVLSFHYFPHQINELKNLAKSSEALQVHHFFNEACGCSKKIISHLKTRRALPAVVETVHYIGTDKRIQADLRAAGFVVEELLEQDAVDRYNVEALPLLVLMDQGREVYKGGYGRDQQHSNVYDDERIIASFVSHPDRSPSGHPVYGCANGKARKSLLDLGGFKYE